MSAGSSATAGSLAIDPDARRRIVTFPPDDGGEATARDPGQPLAARPTTRGAADRRYAAAPRGHARRGPGRPTPALARPEPGPGRTGRASRSRVDLLDGDGRLHRVDGGTARFDGDGQRIDVPLTTEVDGRTVAIAGPLRLAASS